MSLLKMLLIGTVLGLALAVTLASPMANRMLARHVAPTASYAGSGGRTGHCQMHGDSRVNPPDDAAAHASALNALLAAPANTADAAAPAANGTEASCGSCTGGCCAAERRALGASSAAYPAYDVLTPWVSQPAPAP